MRRTFGFLMLLSCVAMMAAAPKATPHPTATPIPSSTPFTSSAPSVMVYPFEVPSDVDPKTGQAIAQIYSQVFVQAGGLTVLSPATPIKREDYAKYARTQHADYYVSGYVQPIGTAASIVATIVDANSEVSKYAVTTHIESVPEVASQAVAMRNVLLQVAGIDRPQIAEQKATPPPTSDNGASVNVGNVLGNIFKGRSKSKATPAPVAAVTKPSRAVIVNHVWGNATTADQDTATSSMTGALQQYFKVSALKNPVRNTGASADAICGTNRDNTIATGTLNATREGRIRAYNSYSFKMDIYTCFGAVLYTTTETGTDLPKVVQTAVSDYQKANPNNR